MEKWLEKQMQWQAERIPEKIRRIILENRFIDIAVNLHDFNTPMEYLFDVYEEFIDTSAQYDDFGCHPCRQHILDDWKKLKPFLEKIQNATT
jgi:hypothetical protein